MAHIDSTPHSIGHSGRASRLAQGAGLLLVVAMAAVLRIGWAGVYSFSYDEARTSLLALQMARRGQIATVGIQSSAGLPNFPAAVWLFALPYLLTSDPLLVTLFVGLLGVLAAAGVWWLAKEAWGPWAGLTAGVLAAGSPWMTLYSRAIWGQDLLAPLAVAWAVLGVVGAAGEGRRWALAGHVFLAGFSLQVHYAGVALIPATAWMILRFRLWRQWPYIIIGATGAALCTLPFLRTLFCCAPQVWGTLRSALGQTPKLDLVAIRLVWQMSTGADWEWLLLGADWSWPAVTAESMRWASRGTGVLLAVGLAAVVRQAWRQRGAVRRDVGAILANLAPAWAFSASLVFLRHSVPVYHQYQLASLPALFLCAGAVAGLWRRRAWGAAVSALAVCLAVVQMAPVARGLSVVAERLTPGGMGTPLSRLRSATDALKDGSPVIVYAHGDSAEFFGDVAGLDVLLWGYPHRIVDGRSALLLPALEAGSSAHLMSMFADIPAWGMLGDLGVRGRTATYPRREGEPPYVVLTVGDTRLSGFQDAPSWTLANGAQLRGWRAQMTDGRLRFATWWSLVGPLAQGDYHQFNHFRVTSEGEPLAIRDVPLSSRAWRVGDDLVTWVDLDPPAVAGPLWVDIGMYTWPDVQRAAVLARPGDPLAPIRLGPIVGVEG